jgi:hypothetical protein
MKEIVNSRLFTTVRDSLGLTYDVSFELSMFERLATGWCACALSLSHSPCRRVSRVWATGWQRQWQRPVKGLWLSGGSVG